MTFSPHQLARVTGLKLLKSFGRDISIRHHWVPAASLSLHSFKHKGYWWHGKNREATALKSIASLIQPGQTVIDVGAHIGYFSIYFANLVGPTGRVVAFEPSEENLRYTRPNLAPLQQVQLETRGISNQCGECKFYVESLTGQNNSLVANYQVLQDNAARAGQRVTTREVTIQVTTMDTVVRELDLAPHFIKVDIEAAEYEALQGMVETLAKHRPNLLVEITRNHAECFELLSRHRYQAADESLKPLSPRVFERDAIHSGSVNYFFLPT